MNDTWNTTGVKWSNENIERELAKVEKTAQLLADRFLRDKLILLVVVTGALLVCLFCMDSMTALIVEVIILVIVMRHLKQAAKKSQAPIYQMCDPYMEFAYIRAYARKPMPKTKSSERRKILSLAQCMALAGEPQAAIAIQNLIEEPQKMKVAERCIYYNTLLLSYGLYGWAEKRRALTGEIKRAREKSGKMEGMQLDVILRLEEVKRRQEMGDIEYVENYFKKVPPVYRFQEVGMHSALGMMYMKSGDAESAREHVEFVLDKGNKLYYKKNMEDYLRGGLDDEQQAEEKQ